MMGTRCGVAIGVALLTASVAAQKVSTPRKTPWGEPDLRGTYTSDNSIGVPFERPPQYGDRPMLTDYLNLLFDEFVDCGLLGRIDLFELQAHADAAVAPRDP